MGTSPKPLISAMDFSISVLMALVMSVLLIATASFIFFYHHRKHEDLDQWIDYSFSRATLKHVLLYYRFIAISMLVFYALFVINLLLFQGDDIAIYKEGAQGLIASSFFAFDLVTRGALFDVMEHWDWSLTPLHMNRKLFWFVTYCFVFRMFYALTLIRIVISFAWIWTKLRSARRYASMGDDTSS